MLLLPGGYCRWDYHSSQPDKEIRIGQRFGLSVQVFGAGAGHPGKPSGFASVYSFSAGPLNNWIWAQFSVYGTFWDDVWNRGFHCHHKSGESRWSVKFMSVLNCIFLSLCEMNSPQQHYWGEWCRLNCSLLRIWGFICLLVIMVCVFTVRARR